MHSDLSQMTGGRVNSSLSKIFYGSTASTVSTVRPSDAGDNYQDDLTDEDLDTYESLEQCQYNQSDAVLTAHDGSDDPVNRKL